MKWWKNSYQKFRSIIFMNWNSDWNGLINVVIWLILVSLETASNFSSLISRISIKFWSNLIQTLFLVWVLVKPLWKQFCVCPSPLFLFLIQRIVRKIEIVEFQLDVCVEIELNCNVQGKKFYKNLRESPCCNFHREDYVLAWFISLKTV